jgi:integrase
MTKRAIQKKVATFGEHGATVRVFKQGELWRVQCRAKRITRSFKGPGAKARAFGYAERLGTGVQEAALTTATVGDLWASYRESSDYTQLRERTRALYAELWALFTSFVPSTRPADEVTVLTLEELRRALETTPRPRAPKGLALSSVRHVIGLVKTVWNWGERFEVLHRNRIHAFRFRIGKDQRVESPDEYTAEELQKLLKVLSFDVIGERTAYCIMAVLGYQGARVKAVTRLRWEDIAWEDDAIIWRAKWDKQGREWDQPMRAPTRAILARLHAAVGEPTEGWVFPARKATAKQPVYTPNSFWLMLTKAEARAGVEQKSGRAAHGFRRGVAGNVMDATGSSALAMEAIGDRDPKMADKYVKRRRGRVGKALRSLDQGDKEQAS